MWFVSKRVRCAGNFQNVLYVYGVLLPKHTSIRVGLILKIRLLLSHCVLYSNISGLVRNLVQYVCDESTSDKREVENELL